MEDPSDAIQANLSSTQRWMLIAAFVAEAIRLILRIIFVIVSETPTAIPLIIFSLLAIVMLIQMKLRGGCLGTFFYVLLEPGFSTILWLCMLFAINTNDSCQRLGDGVCETTTG